MVFSSYQFIFIFLPICILIFYLLNFLQLYTFSKFSVLFSSIYFYYLFQKNILFLILFVFTITFNYFLGNLLLVLKNKHPFIKKIILFVGLSENIGLLFYFKYTDFFINLYNKFLSSNIPFINIILPLGISFFTFRLLSYIIDCYYGKSQKYSILDFFIFMSFFPIIIMGPIVRHNEFIPQLHNKKFFKFDSGNFSKGIFLFSIGLGKKVIISTALLKYTSFAFDINNNVSPIGLWIGMFTNLFAFYFDFSGYSDMASGISCFFNINLKDNFNSPYKARNIKDYWKRWHISLTKFLTDYVFVHFYKLGDSVFKFCIATLITFLISGFWHGAGVNYIIWGILHGICLCVIAIFSVKSTKKFFMPKFLARIITMIILIFAASLYATYGIKDFYRVLKTLFDYKYYILLGKENLFTNIFLTFTNNIYTIFILLISIFICFYSKNTNELSKKIKDKPVLILFSGLIFVVSLFFISEVSTFLYENF